MMGFGAWLKEGNDRAILDIRNATLRNVSIDGGEGQEDRLEVLQRTPAQFQYANFEIVSFDSDPDSPRAGWASETSFRNAETAVQRAIVSNARAAVGQLSGQSRIFGTAPGDRGTGWLTDAYGGDGQRMRDAIGIYDDWFTDAVNRDTVPQHIRDGMFVALGANVPAGQGYSSAEKDALVDRIVEQYNGFSAQGSVAVPGDDNSTLQFLAIQKQCIEWNSTIALASGGQARGYNTRNVTDPADYRPGMALLRNNTHAMLITDIEWDANGNPIRFRVAEANAEADVWSNPDGQVPWQRTIREIVVSASTAGLRVIRME
jgi:hypothetical protein